MVAEEDQIKECLECKIEIEGRIDKKFCSDYCRNSYNNKVNKDSKNLIRNTNNRLRKNYKILTDLNKSGKTKVKSHWRMTVRRILLDNDCKEGR